MLIRPIVANVDYLAIQFAAKHPNIDFERINLLLLTAFYYKVKPIVIVNKIAATNPNTSNHTAVAKPRWNKLVKLR